MNIEVIPIAKTDWQRLRALRLASLLDTPEAFGATHENESQLTANDWHERFNRVSFFIASVDGIDCALMSVEELTGDFGANVWLGGCWVDPRYRGKGVMRALLNYIDQLAPKNGWQRQGLGVWHDNYKAIASYERLGFVKMGELAESTRKPGKFFQRMIRDTPNYLLCRL